MGDPLAQVEDVELLYAPLAGADEDTQLRVVGLIRKASALLRQRLPWVDDRIARFKVNPADLGGLDPDVVSDVVATMVKRFLVNASGATSQSETVGPYQHSTSFVIRGEKDVVLGELYVAPSDIDKLRGAVRMSPKIGTGRMGSTIAGGRGGRVLGAWPPGMGTYDPDTGWINPPDGTP